MSGATEDAMTLETQSASISDKLSCPSHPKTKVYFDKILREPHDTSNSVADTLEIDLRTYCGDLLQSIVAHETKPAWLISFWNEALEVIFNLVEFLGNEEESSCLAPAMDHFIKIPFLLLDDIVDSLDTAAALVFWSTNLLPTSTLFFDTLWSHKQTRLVFIKTSTKFLRRLRSEHMTNGSLDFSGAALVLKTLSSVYPVNERSAFRAFGTNNEDNMVVLDAESDFEDTPVANENQELNRSGKQNHLSYGFYKSLWTLQHDFRKPYSTIVPEFLKRLTSVLRTFEANNDKMVLTPKMVMSKAHFEPYATNNHLLSVQLQDPAFLIAILTQLWIGASHWGFTNPALRRQLIPHLKTSEKLLPAEFHGLLNDSSIFRHSEKQWIDWKQDKARRDLDAKKEPPVSKQRKRAPSAMSILGDDKDLPGAKENAKKMRLCLPATKEFLEPYVDAIDPEAGIEEEYHPRHDALFSWRAIRLLGESKLEALFEVQPDGDFEIPVRKLYESEFGILIPGECPEPGVIEFESTVEDIEENEENEQEETNKVKIEPMGLEEPDRVVKEEDCKNETAGPICEVHDNHDSHVKAGAPENGDVVGQIKPDIASIDEKDDSTSGKKRKSEELDDSNVHSETAVKGLSSSLANEPKTPEINDTTPSKTSETDNTDSQCLRPSSETANKNKSEPSSEKQKSINFERPQQNSRRPPEVNAVQNRRGQPRFQPRVPDRRDSRISADIRARQPQIPPDRLRGDRLQQDDRNRDRARPDQRRGDHPQRGHGDERRRDNRGWRHGDRRR